MNYATPTIWLIIAAIGVGTYLIRFSFLGIIGNRELPPWALRLLRYTPVAVMPGLVAPLVVWPEATGGTPEISRLSAAAVTLAVGMATKNLIAAVVAGAGTLYLMMYLTG
ncbi:MAG: AzlD domain-containing protein [Pseudomonadota bacterium]